jgi:hypothetical protein
VRVVNQFHQQGIEVDISRPDLLLVPSGKGEGQPPPPYTEGIDHFQCYRIVSGGAFLRSDVSVTDQFDTTTVGVKRAIRLCVPVTKNTEGIIDGSKALMCYKARNHEGSPSDYPIYTTNQLETTTDAVFGLREFCAPSLLNPGEPTPIPTPTATATVTPTPTPTVTQTVIPSPQPTAVPCGDFDQCSGPCPDGQVCSATNEDCRCASGSTPCAGTGDPDFPACGGACPDGLVCESVSANGQGACVCSGPAPCPAGFDEICFSATGFICPPEQTCSFAQLDLDTAGCGCFPD